MKFIADKTLAMAIRFRAWCVEVCTEVATYRKSKRSSRTCQLYYWTGTRTGQWTFVERWDATSVLL